MIPRELKLSAKYLPIIIVYTTILSFITGEFGAAMLFGIIVLIAALVGLIVIHVGETLIKLDIIPVKIKPIIKSVSESFILPFCIGAGIFGLFVGFIYEGFGIAVLITGMILIIAMGLKIIAYVFDSTIKSPIKFLIVISVLGISAIILAPVLNLLLLSVLHE